MTTDNRFSEDRLDRFTSFDGTTLDIHIWEPETPRAVFLAVHGGLAHAGDWVTPARWFREKGIATAAYDLRGHKRETVCIDRFGDFVKDTCRFREWVTEQFPGLPLFYLGHSVGGLIGTHLGLGLGLNPDDCRFKGFVFSAPYYGNAIKVNPLVMSTVRLLGRFLPGLPIPGEDITGLLTHDPEITQRHRRDEQDGIRAAKASMGFGAELLRAQEAAAAGIHTWKHPLFVVVAGDDRVADTACTQAMLDKIDPGLLTRLTREKNFHENFNETDRETIFEEIHEWMLPLMTP